MALDKPTLLTDNFTLHPTTAVVSTNFADSTFSSATYNANNANLKAKIDALSAAVNALQLYINKA
jgi:hypothetical protein